MYKIFPAIISGSGVPPQARGITIAFTNSKGKRNVLRKALIRPKGNQKTLTATDKEIVKRRIHNLQFDDMMGHFPVKDFMEVDE